mgnify:CR=1 FL=1
MRRQKRDMTERGWREGRTDHWDGIDTATALEKQAFH